MPLWPFGLLFLVTGTGFVPPPALSSYRGFSRRLGREDISLGQVLPLFSPRFCPLPLRFRLGFSGRLRGRAAHPGGGSRDAGTRPPHSGIFSISLDPRTATQPLSRLTSASWGTPLAGEYLLPPLHAELDIPPWGCSTQGSPPSSSSLTLTAPSEIIFYGSTAGGAGAEAGLGEVPGAGHWCRCRGRCPSSPRGSADWG